ncbi:MAG TPA: HAMP domain-containing methyl-accepting chemotaxis protein [Stenomitos sp.]
MHTSTLVSAALCFGIFMLVIGGVYAATYLRTGRSLHLKLRVMPFPMYALMVIYGWLSGHFGLKPVVIATITVLGLLTTKLTNAAIAHWVTGPLAELNGIAEGDLQAQLNVSSEDEMGRVARGFQRMLENLRGMVSRIRAAAGIVATNAEVVTQTSAELADAVHTQVRAVEVTDRALGHMEQGLVEVTRSVEVLQNSILQASSTSEQLSVNIAQVSGNADLLLASVTETTASVVQVASSIQQVAASTHKANGLSLTAASAAREGAASVEQTMAGMGRINQNMSEALATIQQLGQQSERIGAIVEVIDEIAGQTNLLALNAAIEAARAGEHGRGFAVVADEVRKLAERSTRATAEIATLIQSIQKGTDQAVQATQRGDAATQEGLALSRSAGEALQSIVETVDQVATYLSAIDQATGEQAESAQQILGASDRMRDLTQQVTHAAREQADGSRQIVSAMDSITAQAGVVSRFIQEQHRADEELRQAVGQIRRETEVSANVNVRISHAAQELEQETRALLGAIAFLHDAEAPSSGSVTARQALMPVPALRPGGQRPNTANYGG